MDIIALLKKPEGLKDVPIKNINDVADEISILLESKINKNCIDMATSITFGDIELPKAAFKCVAKDVVRDAIRTYCAHKKWNEDIPIIPYVSTALNRLSKNMVEDIKGSNKKVLNFVCPACREFKIREILIKENNKLICRNCTIQIETIEKELIELKVLENENQEINSNNKIKILEKKLYFLKVFYNHSKKGFKCFKCKKFIPDSYKGKTCPYLKCREILDKEEIVNKNHPVTFCKRQFVSINNAVSKYSDDKKDFSEKYCNMNGNAYDLLSTEEEKKNELKKIKDIINKQKKTNGNTRKIPIKISMYEAFDAALEEFPEEMVNYLVNGGQNGDVSIQAIIFQKFVDIIISKLPIIVFIKGIQIKINDLLDDRLNIFNGKRKFTSFMDHNLIIKKVSQFRIDDGIEIEDNSDNFIGKISKIINSKGEDVSHLIDSYSFSNIKMQNSEFLKPAEDITVEYYSLRPSYTLGILIHIQRIKKRISDSIKR